MVTYGNVEPGSQIRILEETTPGAGTTSRECSVQSDTVLATLWVESIAGSLDVTIYAFTDDDHARRVAIASFPSITAPTTFLLQKRGSIATSRVQVEAVYTGIVNYEIYIRAIQAGLVDTRILGANTLRMSQKDVTAVVSTLLPASLTDRAGIVVKNWSAAGTAFLGGVAGEATQAAGFPLGPKDALAVDLAAGQAVWAISDGGTIDIRISEAGS